MFLKAWKNQPGFFAFWNQYSIYKYLKSVNTSHSSRAARSMPDFDSRALC